MALSMLILIWELAKEILSHLRSTSANHAGKKVEQEQVPRETVVKFLLVAGWIAALGVLIWLFGFLIAFQAHPRRSLRV